MANTLNPNLRPFWETIARNRVLVGGRSSSKSWDAAGVAVIMGSMMTLRFCCTRQFQNKIAESVYVLLKIQIENLGLRDEYHIDATSIRHKLTGTEFLFYGLARNIDEIKSLEGIDILWIEEAHNLTHEQWKILEPTIRKEGSQVWVIFNPKFATDFVYQRFVVNPPPDTIVRHINFNENPFLSDTMKRIIDAARLEDEEEFAHVYLGVPLTDDDRVIIKRSWFNAAIDAHLRLGFEPEGADVLGYDVADDGDDKNAYVKAKGSVALACMEWKGGEDKLTKSVALVYSAAEEGSKIVYDSIGVGAFVGAKLNELTEGQEDLITHEGFNAGGAVRDPKKYYMREGKKRNIDMFSNLKAQAWWAVADRFRNTYEAINTGKEFPPDQLISISSDIPDLAALGTELCTPRRDFDKNGKVKVESKDDLKARKVKSPNRADAFIMAFEGSTNSNGFFS